MYNKNKTQRVENLFLTGFISLDNFRGKFVSRFLEKEIGDICVSAILFCLNDLRPFLRVSQTKIKRF